MSCVDLGFQLLGTGIIKHILSVTHVHYFPPSEIYLLGLVLGPRQVPVGIRIRLG